MSKCGKCVRVFTDVYIIYSGSLSLKFAIITIEHIRNCCLMKFYVF